jgi:hypothetical protein
MSPRPNVRKEPAQLKPSLSLLVKLGSIAVHADELLSLEAHEFDRIALEQLVNDTEVRQWVASMERLALLPVKRS